MTVSHCIWWQEWGHVSLTLAQWEACSLYNHLWDTPHISISSRPAVWSSWTSRAGPGSWILNRRRPLPRFGELDLGRHQCETSACLWRISVAHHLADELQSKHLADQRSVPLWVCSSGTVAPSLGRWGCGRPVGGWGWACVGPQRGFSYCARCWCKLAPNQIAERDANQNTWWGFVKLQQKSFYSSRDSSTFWQIHLFP